MVIFLKNVVSALIMSFLAENQKFLNIRKIRKYDGERISFEEKTFSSFQIAYLPIWEGAKYAGVSRPSCYLSPPQVVRNF